MTKTSRKWRLLLGSPPHSSEPQCGFAIRFYVEEEASWFSACLSFANDLAVASAVARQESVCSEAVNGSVSMIVLTQTAKRDGWGFFARDDLALVTGMLLFSKTVASVATSWSHAEIVASPVSLSNTLRSSSWTRRARLFSSTSIRSKSKGTKGKLSPPDSRAQMITPSLSILMLSRSASESRIRFFSLFSMCFFSTA